MGISIKQQISQLGQLYLKWSIIFESGVEHADREWQLCSSATYEKTDPAAFAAVILFLKPYEDSKIHNYYSDRILIFNK
mgnify:CR=1 FL=1